MRQFILIGVLLVVGCQDGQDPGAIGNQQAAVGPPGDPGPPSGTPGIVWADATGAVVSGLTGGVDLNRQPNYFDPDGNVWGYSLVADVAVPLDMHNFGFESSDCSGTPYIYSINLQTHVLPPRVAFSSPADETFRIRDDVTPEETRTICSALVNTTTCDPQPPGCREAFAVPVSSTIIVPYPTVPGTRPLHPELH